MSLWRTLPATRSGVTISEPRKSISAHSKTALLPSGISFNRALRKPSNGGTLRTVKNRNFLRSWHRWSVRFQRSTRILNNGSGFPVSPPTGLFWPQPAEVERGLDRFQLGIQNRHGHESRCGGRSEPHIENFNQ